jgi:hypothetical protein
MKFFRSKGGVTNGGFVETFCYGVDAISLSSPCAINVVFRAIESTWTMS